MPRLSRWRERPAADRDGLWSKVVVGTKSTSSAPLDSDFFVARLNADGSLDTSFDGDGMATIDFNHGDDQGRAVSITAHNHILIVGSSYGTHTSGGRFGR